MVARHAQAPADLSARGTVAVRAPDRQLQRRAEQARSVQQRAVQLVGGLTRLPVRWPVALRSRQLVVRRPALASPIAFKVHETGSSKATIPDRRQCRELVRVPHGW